MSADTKPTIAALGRTGKEGGGLNRRYKVTDSGIRITGIARA